MRQVDLARSLMDRALDEDIEFESSADDGPQKVKGLRFCCYKLRQAARTLGQHQYDELSFEIKTGGGLSTSLIIRRKA